MRCRNCQLLGHTTKRCKGNTSCETCNLPPHNPDNCTRVSCANCFEDHPSSSKECKRYQQARETLKIKTLKKCSMAEAKKLYKEQNPTSLFSTTYSAIAKTATQNSQHISTTINSITPVNISNPDISPSSNPPPTSQVTPTPTKSQNNPTTQPNKLQPLTTPSSSSSIVTAKQKNTIKQVLNEHTHNTVSHNSHTTNPTKQSTFKSNPTQSTNSSSHENQAKANPNLPSTHNSSIHTSSPHTLPLRPSQNSNTTQTTTLIHSPISTVTQSLLKNNKYFINPSDLYDDDT